MNAIEIKELRTRLNLTQEEFAVKLGVVGFTIRRWESSKARPSRLALKQLERLALSKSKG